jgi:signal transduction histidine kinase
MLAHELRRPMAAVRVAGEAVALLRDQGRDITPMLDLLLGEVGDLDALATDVLGDRRDRPAKATPHVAATAHAAARTVATARRANVRVQAGGPARVEVVVADRGAVADAPGGHGIGLFVVRWFLDEAGGRSWVTHREGGGTLVGLRMPLRPGDEPDRLDTAVNT